MAGIEADIALLTERRYTATRAEPNDWYLGNILREDHLLQTALTSLGFTSVRLDWSIPEVNWSKFRVAVFRTTWDYFDRFAEFSAWLGRVEKQTRLCNDAALVAWNMDKHYLRDLEVRGIPVVQSHYLERGSDVALPDLLDRKGWEEAVLKPCVSGAARHTYRVNRENAAAVNATMQQLLKEESLILQPLQQDVLRTGEDTLVVFQGRFSHAVRKVAKSGDFRVQDDYGGTVHPHQPTNAQIELAEHAMAVCRPIPAYGRVDMIRDNEGRLAIMELELIEPELWLRNDPPSAHRFAKAIAEFASTRE